MWQDSFLKFIDSDKAREHAEVSSSTSTQVSSGSDNDGDLPSPIPTQPDAISLTDSSRDGDLPSPIPNQPDTISLTDSSRDGYLPSPIPTQPDVISLTDSSRDGSEDKGEVINIDSTSSDGTTAPDRAKEHAQASTSSQVRSGSDTDEDLPNPFTKQPDTVLLRDSSDGSGDKGAVIDTSGTCSDRTTAPDRKFLPPGNIGLRVQDACRIILEGKDYQYLESVPYDCTKTETFIIDTSKLPDRNDVRVHMAGAMKNDRVQKDFVSIKVANEEVRDITVLKKKPTVTRNSIYRLTRTYWTSANTKGFKRRLYELYDSTDTPTRFVILQYVVEGNLPSLALHGNSKSCDMPYIRTSKRVMKDLDESLKSKRPKEAYDKVFQDAGGMMGATSMTRLPRNTKQTYNIKQKETEKGKVKDFLYQLIKECKDQQSMADPFLRFVQCAPECLCLCATDLQLLEMEKFLINPAECTIMGIDPTFNLGEFVVTPIVYKNLKLTHTRTSDHPTFLGPLLIHQTRSERAFNFFASSLISLRDPCRHIVYWN